MPKVKLSSRSPTLALALAMNVQLWTSLKKLQASFNELAMDIQRHSWTAM